MWLKIRTWLARRELVAGIRRRGWVQTHVPVGDLGFTYTIGFMETLGAPEIIMFGVTKGQGLHMAREIWRDLKSGALTLADQGRWPPEEAQRIMFRDVHPTQVRREYLNAAIWRHTDRGLTRDSLRVVQVCWPDTQGVFPWEAGYDPAYRPRQFALYEPFEGTIDENEALEVFYSLHH